MGGPTARGEEIDLFVVLFFDWDGCRFSCMSTALSNIRRKGTLTIHVRVGNELFRGDVQVSSRGSVGTAHLTCRILIKDTFKVYATSARVERTGRGLTVLLLPRGIYRFLNRLCQIIMSGTCTFVHLRRPFRLENRTRSSSFRPFTRRNSVELRRPFRCHAHRIVVKASRKGVHRARRFHRVLGSRVGFVVACHRNVVTRRIRRLSLRLTFRGIVVENALQSISTVRRRRVQVLTTGLLCGANATRRATRPNVLINDLNTSKFCATIHVTNIRSGRLFSKLTKQCEVNKRRTGKFFDGSAPLLLYQYKRRRGRRNYRKVRVFREASIFLVLALWQPLFPPYTGSPSYQLPSTSPRAS